MRRRQAGFTAVEIMLIVVVLGVIAAITYPQFRLMLYQSREGRTKANLGDLRGALAIYYSDNFGIYPSADGTPETRLVASLSPRYLKAIPSVELPHFYRENLNTIQDHFDGRGDWLYSDINGAMSVNSTHKGTKGEDISNW